MSDPSPAPTASLLNLDTIIQRPVITIDGSRHEIMAADELSIVETHRLSLGGARMEALAKQSELSEDEQGELRNLLHDLSDLIMKPIAAEHRAKLTDQHRRTVIEVFTTLLLTKKAGTAAGMLEGLMGMAAMPTGATSSPVSRASTAARRKAGSKKPRSRS